LSYIVNKHEKGEPVSEAPQHTQFVSRGRLNGVLRQRPSGGGVAEGANTQPGRERSGLEQLDTEVFEALHYRARLILGDSLPRPGRFGIRDR
jgi:hypothetical protein